MSAIEQRTWLTIPKILRREHDEEKNTVFGFNAIKTRAFYHRADGFGRRFFMVGRSWGACRVRGYPACSTDRAEVGDVRGDAGGYVPRLSEVEQTDRTSIVEQG